MQITLEVPDRLGEKLQQSGDHLPEAPDRALQELTSAETISYKASLNNLSYDSHSPTIAKNEL